jgi:phosphoesterase RecJ-like protein
MMNKFDQIIELVKNAKNILITSHIDPDGDSLGSQLALENWIAGSGGKVRVINQGRIPQRYLFLDIKRVIENLDDLSNPAGEADLVLVLECSNLERAGKVKELIAEDARIINIDHHSDNSTFGSLNYIDAKVGALGEIVYELITYAGYRMNREVATQLYAAILTDTGRFSFSSTTAKTLRICSELIELGADHKEINSQIYYNSSEPALRLLGFALQNLETFEQGKISFMVIGQDSLKNFGASTEELEGFVDYSLFLKGAKVGVLFKQKGKDLTKVSLRSQDSFDVSSLARFFGGGGHKNAAGCSIKKDLESTKELILKKIKEAL